MEVKVKDRQTVYICFTDETPRKFELYNSDGDLYYFRHLNGKTPRIKFNIVHAGRYFGNVPFKVVKVVDIELPKNLPTLPPYERERIKDVTIKYNPNLLDTPARIFTHSGLIEKGVNFYKFPKPVRLFFLLHEIGHLHYQTEEFCDLFAFVHFVQMGYNRSTALYALSKVLTKSEANKKRVETLARFIEETNSKPLNFTNENR